MRRSRLRITIRSLMITIGAVALLLGVGAEARRRHLEEERRRSEWPRWCIPSPTLAPFDNPYDRDQPARPLGSIRQ
jgi:hypothetical protein